MPSIFVKWKKKQKKNIRFELHTWISYVRSDALVCDAFYAKIFPKSFLFGILIFHCSLFIQHMVLPMLMLNFTSSNAPKRIYWIADVLPNRLLGIHHNSYTTHKQTHGEPKIIQNGLIPVQPFELKFNIC